MPLLRHKKLLKGTDGKLVAHTADVVGHRAVTAFLIRQLNVEIGHPVDVVQVVVIQLPDHLVHLLFLAFGGFVHIDGGVHEVPQGQKGLILLRTHPYIAVAIAEDAWETASLDSKTELAKQLAAYELAMLGVLDGTEVTVQPLDEDRLGYYSAASRQIVLSRSVLESGSAQETMDTIAHEAFHVQQAYVVENIDWDDAATQAAYYDQARRWLRNDQNGYVSGEEDILSYYFQPVEIDARAYAAEETERLQGLIDKELQKET